MLKPLMASPISLAPMIRHITAMMTALCWPHPFPHVGQDALGPVTEREIHHHRRRDARRQRARLTLAG